MDEPLNTSLKELKRKLQTIVTVDEKLEVMQSMLSEMVNISNSLNKIATTIGVCPTTKGVARGTWQNTSSHENLFGEQCRCSVCGQTFWAYMKKFRYCASCGADMGTEGSGTDGS